MFRQCLRTPTSRSSRVCCQASSVPHTAPRSRCRWLRATSSWNHPRSRYRRASHGRANGRSHGRADVGPDSRADCVTSHSHPAHHDRRHCLRGRKPGGPAWCSAVARPMSGLSFLLLGRPCGLACFTACLASVLEARHLGLWLVSCLVSVSVQTETTPCAPVELFKR